MILSRSVKGIFKLFVGLRQPSHQCRSQHGSWWIVCSFFSNPSCPNLTRTPNSCVMQVSHVGSITWSMTISVNCLFLRCVYLEAFVVLGGRGVDILIDLLFLMLFPMLYNATFHYYRYLLPNKKNKSIKIWGQIKKKRKQSLVSWNTINTSDYLSPITKKIGMNHMVVLAIV